MPGAPPRNCSTEAAAVPGRVGANGPACEVTAAVSALCGFGAEQALAGCGGAPRCLRSIVAHRCPHNLGCRWLMLCCGHQGPATSLEALVGLWQKAQVTPPRPISSDVPFTLSRWGRGAAGVGGSPCVPCHPHRRHVKRFLTCVTISYSDEDPVR